MICPCKDCNERFVGCHGYCENYQKWVINKNKEKIVNMLIEHSNSDYRDYFINKNIELKKRYRR